MTTALSLITASMRTAGILTQGESPSSEEANQALEILNDIMASLSNDSLYVYARTLESFALTAGDGEYTIGAGGDFNTTRPIKIISAYIRIGNTDYDLGLATDEAFANIPYKAVISGIPDFLNYTNDYPLGTIKLYPLPNGGTIYILSEKPLTGFAALSTDISLPPGWNRMLKHLLAVELQPTYGQEVNQTLVALAEDAVKKVKTAIAKSKTMDATLNVGGSDNIYTGWYT